MSFQITNRRVLLALLCAICVGLGLYWYMFQRQCRILNLESQESVIYDQTKSPYLITYKHDPKTNSHWLRMFDWQSLRLVREREFAIGNPHTFCSLISHDHILLWNQLPDDFKQEANLSRVRYDFAQDKFDEKIIVQHQKEDKLHTPFGCRYLAHHSAADKAIHCYEVATGNRFASVPWKTGGIAAISPDGNFLLVCYIEKSMAEVWDLESQQLKGTINHELFKSFELWEVQFSADCTKFILPGPHPINRMSRFQIYDVRSLEPLPETTPWLIAESSTLRIFSSRWSADPLQIHHLKNPDALPVSFDFKELPLQPEYTSYSPSLFHEKFMVALVTKRGFRFLDGLFKSDWLENHRYHSQLALVDMETRTVTWERNWYFKECHFFVLNFSNFGDSGDYMIIQYNTETEDYAEIWKLNPSWFRNETWIIPLGMGILTFLLLLRLLRTRKRA